MEKHGNLIYGTEEEITKAINERTISDTEEGSSVLCPYSEYKTFTEWVIYEIFEDEMELDFDSFAEFACRKLEKMGLVKLNGNEWEKV